MRIHLHLGMPKTGTSSLQAALLKTYGSAQPQKIWYPIPERMGHGHADLGWRAMGHGDIRPEPTILIDLARRARAAGCEDLVLNSEVFTHAMLGAGRATIIALARYGEPLPIVTLTALGSRTNSIWQEIVKSLGGDVFENSYDRVAGPFVEVPFVSRVAEAFPDRAIPVICVDRSDDPGTLFRRFSEASGIALIPESRDAAAQNRSLYRLEADLMAGLARSFGNRTGAEEEYRYAQYRMLRLFESADWRATGPQTRVAYPHAWTGAMAARAAAAVAGLKALEAAGRIRILGDVERLDDVTRPYKWPGVDIHRGSPMTAASIVFVPQPTGTGLEEVLSCAWSQSLADFELLIAVGHCDADTRAAARAIAARDPRVRVLESPQTADVNALRHAALGEARGAVVAYLDEADIWLPHHLACLCDVLQEAEFAHGLHAVQVKNDNIQVQPCDLSNPDLRHFMAGTELRRFGLGLVGHRLDAYRRLTGGWHSLPQDAL